MSVSTEIRRTERRRDEGGEEHWHRWSADVGGSADYVMKDVIGAKTLGGAAAAASFAEGFHTDRVMPRRVGHAAVIPQVYLGPDNFID